MDKRLVISVAIIAFILTVYISNEEGKSSDILGYPNETAYSMSCNELRHVYDCDYMQDFSINHDLEDNPENFYAICEMMGHTDLADCAAGCGCFDTLNKFELGEVDCEVYLNDLRFYVKNIHQEGVMINEVRINLRGDSAVASQYPNEFLNSGEIMSMKIPADCKDSVTMRIEINYTDSSGTHIDTGNMYQIDNWIAV